MYLLFVFDTAASDRKLQCEDGGEPTLPIQKLASTTPINPESKSVNQTWTVSPVHLIREKPYRVIDDISVLLYGNRVVNERGRKQYRTLSRHQR
jgi:hypothetical protein